MSNRKRQYCPRGHDTFVEGRDASYRCVRCKRDDGKAAYAARRDEEEAAWRAEMTKRHEQLRRQNEAWLRRTRRKGAVR
jgi:hypothetical protein